jgi:hypothetical protein
LKSPSARSDSRLSPARLEIVLAFLESMAADHTRTPGDL